MGITALWPIENPGRIGFGDVSYEDVSDTSWNRGYTGNIGFPGSNRCRNIEDSVQRSGLGRVIHLKKSRV